MIEKLRQTSYTLKFILKLKVFHQLQILMVVKLVDIKTENLIRKIISSLQFYRKIIEYEKDYDTMLEIMRNE